MQIVLKLITLEELEIKFISRATSVWEPDALFSSRSDEPGNQFESSMFKFADPSKLGRSLLEGNKGHLLSQARSELMRQENEVGSFNSCINELQQQAYPQCKTLTMDMLNLEENKLRDSQIRNIHELDEMEESSRTTS